MLRVLLVLVAMIVFVGLPSIVVIEFAKFMNDKTVTTRYERNALTRLLNKRYGEQGRVEYLRL